VRLNLCGSLSLLRQRASRLGEDPEAYRLEPLSRDVDPGERVEVYLAASRWFLEEGTGLLAAGDVRQASEKLWNAVVQSVKAYAEAAGTPHEQTDTGHREEAGEGQRGDARLLAAVAWRNDPSSGRRNAATIHPTETLPPPHPACPAADSRPTGLADAKSP
jgi:hypothetical protein